MNKNVQIIQIDSILGGISDLQYFGAKGQYSAGIGIDPDFPIDDTVIRSSGFIRPTAMATFSGANVNANPLWIETNPKDQNIYVYLANGRVISYDSALGTETLVATNTSSSGGGIAYYDNYLYFRKNTDIARYGPLNGTPSMTESYWVTTLSLAALTNTTYPSLRGIAIPNGMMHRHIDDRLYFCDVQSNRGRLSYIKTTITTVEGDTNNGSTAGALLFDHGEYPICIETYGNDLAIGLIEGVGTTTRQKPAKIAFWDTISGSFYKKTDVELPDPIITAIKNINGVLYVWCGNASGGYRILRFVGGYSFEEVFYSEEGTPPLQGAIDHDLNRIYWGNFITFPENSASVFAHGSKMRRLSLGVHNVLNATLTGANFIVTALKMVLHANNSRVRPIIGVRDDSNTVLQQLSSTYGISVWESEVFRVGKPFKIQRIIIPLAQAVAANMTLIPTLYYDERSSSEALTTINSTNFANSERNAIIIPAQGEGKHNFSLQLRWSGTALLTVSLPIIIEWIPLNY